MMLWTDMYVTLVERMRFAGMFHTFIRGLE